MEALSARDDVKRLVDLVPEEDLPTLRRLLRGLLRERDPVVAGFANAPEDDEEVTEEDVAALEEADRANAEGRVVSHERARRILLEGE